MPLPKRFTDEEQRQKKNAGSRERYRENKERILAYHAQLYQEKKLKNPEFLAINAAKVAAQRKANPKAAKAVAKRARDRHIEIRRQQTREWFARNPEKRVAYEQNRRAKKLQRGGKLAPDIAPSLMKLQRGKCACCRVELKSVKAHLDHIMPLALGGAHVSTNVQMLCQPCNQAKHAKHPIDFMQERGFLI